MELFLKISWTMEWFQRCPEPWNEVLKISWNMELFKDLLNQYGFKDLLNHYDFKDLLNHGMISKISWTMEWFQRSPEPWNGFKDILNLYGFKDFLKLEQ